MKRKSIIQLIEGKLAILLEAGAITEETARLTRETYSQGNPDSTYLLQTLVGLGYMPEGTHIPKSRIDENDKLVKNCGYLKIREHKYRIDAFETIESYHLLDAEEARLFKLDRNEKDIEKKSKMSRRLKLFTQWYELHPLDSEFLGSDREIREAKEILQDIIDERKASSEGVKR